MTSDDRKNSLERELKNENLTMITGEVSRERHMKSKKEIEQQKERTKLVDSKAMMLEAAKRSKENTETQKGVMIFQHFFIMCKQDGRTSRACDRVTNP